MTTCLPPILALSILSVSLASSPRAQNCEIGPAALPAGQATSSTSGMPSLSLSALPQVGDTFPEAQIEAAGLPGASGILVLGQVGSPMPLPSLGATLIPAAPLRSRPFVLDAAGCATVQISALPTVPPIQCGLEFVVQAAVVDPAAQGGYAVTSALRVRAGHQARGPFFDDQRLHATGEAGVLADVNGDGLQDIVVADRFANVRALLGTRDALFVPGPEAEIGVDPLSFTAPTFLATADLDGDGDPDFIAGNHGPASLSVLINQGGGSFDVSTVAGDTFAVHGLALGDVNGDGLSDLAVLHPTQSFVADTVTLLRGQVGGGFGAPTSTSLPQPGRSIALVDLDLDGVLDLLTTTSCETDCTPSEGRLQTWIGQGDGTFMLLGDVLIDTATFSVYADDIAIGDINADGLPDVVCNARLHFSMHTRSYGHAFLNQGDGSLAPSWSGPLSALTPVAYVRHIALADFDEDGALDIVAATWNPGVTLARGVGDGSFLDFESVVAGTSANFVLPSDLDGDNHVDLVALRAQIGQISVSPGLGDGTFLQPPPSLDLPGFPRAALLRDLNGDGRRDLLLLQADGDSGTLLLRSATPDGGFEDGGVWPAGAGPVALEFADLDGDGLSEVLVLDADDNALLSLRPDGLGGFEPAVSAPLPAGAELLAVGDLDGDGRDDVVVTTYSGLGTGKAEVRLSVGDGTFTSAPDLEFEVNSTDIEIADFDGDGLLDVIIGRRKSQGIGVYLGDGTGGFTPGVFPDTTGILVTSIEVADFDADGVLDLAASGYTMGDAAGETYPAGLATWHGLGGGLTSPPTLVLAPSDAYGLAIGDLNADGIPDVLAAIDEDAVTVLIGRGDASFEAPLGFHSGFTSGRLHVGDLTGDGVPDLYLTAGERVIPSSWFE